MSVDMGAKYLKISNEQQFSPDFKMFKISDYNNGLGG